MYYIIIKTLRYIKNLINKLIISFLVKYKMTYLLSLLFIFNLTKIEKIKPSKNIKYKAIVLGKSGGTEDLIESQKKYNQNILYLNCSRKFFKFIYQTIQNSHLTNSKTISNRQIENFKNEYLEFLIIFLRRLKKNL